MAGPSQDRGNPEPNLGFYAKTARVLEALPESILEALPGTRLPSSSSDWPRKSEVRSRQKNFGACVVNVSVATRPELSGESPRLQKSTAANNTPQGSSPHRRRTAAPPLQSD